VQQLIQEINEKLNLKNHNKEEKELRIRLEGSEGKVIRIVSDTTMDAIKTIEPQFIHVHIVPDTLE